jgi:hypothetical protein
MSRPSLVLLSLLLPVACQTADATEASPFQADLAEGHTVAEHTEVAPGVYLLSSKLAEGAVHYVSAEDAAARAETRSRIGDDTCYNYDEGHYQDELQNESMFGASPSWYGSTTAVSYDFDAPGTAHDQDYEQVSAYLWSYVANPVTVFATAYVYVNGDYVGYVDDHARRGTTALAYEIFDAACEDGMVSVEIRTYHTWSDGSSGQYLYLSNTATASVECCP